jgi:hypothetical protein
MIDGALSWLSSADRELIKSGSAADDHGLMNQSPHNAFMHSMKAPGQENSVALAQRDAFVNTKLALARSLEGKHEHAAALVAFGEAVHPLMDATSPFHLSSDGNPRTWALGESLLGTALGVDHGILEMVVRPTDTQQATAQARIQAAYSSVFH